MIGPSTFPPLPTRTEVQSPMQLNVVEVVHGSVPPPGGPCRPSWIVTGTNVAPVFGLTLLFWRFFLLSRPVVVICDPVSWNPPTKLGLELKGVDKVFETLSPWLWCASEVVPPVLSKLNVTENGEAKPVVSYATTTWIRPPAGRESNAQERDGLVWHVVP